MGELITISLSILHVCMKWGELFLPTLVFDLQLFFFQGLHFGRTIYETSFILHMYVRHFEHFPLLPLSLTLTVNISRFKVKCKTFDKSFKLNMNVQKCICHNELQSTIHCEPCLWHSPSIFPVLRNILLLVIVNASQFGHTALRGFLYMYWNLS